MQNCCFGTFFLVLLACSDTSGGGGGGGGGDCDEEFCRPDATVCDEERPIEIQAPKPPDLLLVVDKSKSMLSELNGVQRWATMHTALESMLGDNTERVHFGLLLYPDGDACAAGMVSTPVNVDSNAAIATSLAATTPDGSTPTHSSLGNALTYFEGATVNPNGRYVLLATDGEPNCAGGADAVDESVTAITALHTAGIRTFVLGFGNGVNVSTLQAMADAGGHDQYYAADSPAELEAALDAITGAVAPKCVFTLGEVPVNPQKMRLFFDGEEVGRTFQHTDGWDYDIASNTITIYGTSCDELRGGSVTNVKVDYGCEGSIID